MKKIKVLMVTVTFGEGSGVNSFIMNYFRTLDHSKVIKIASKADEKQNQVNINDAQKALKKAEELMTSKKFNFLLLDEINCAVYFNLLKEKDVHELLDKKPRNCEIILTGRCCTESLIKRADLVTEMKEIKHPWKECQMNAREGTEY